MATVRKARATEVSADLEFVLSDETRDRMGDVIIAAGWKLAAFRKNPIALFGHKSSEPIGTWRNVRVEGKRLVGQLAFAAPGTSARIDELRSLTEQGILRAVSVGFKPVKEQPSNPETPWRDITYLESELLECSLVSVPANPNAVQLAKSMHVSDAVLDEVFGEHADGDLATVRRAASPGEHAVTPPKTGTRKMRTLSERIADAQTSLNEKRDALAELNKADALDLDAIEDLNSQIEVAERALTAMKASEANIQRSMTPATPAPSAAPAFRRSTFSQREVGGLDLLVRSVVANGCAMFSGKSIDAVLDERYPGHEATAAVTKTDQTIGTTSVAGWAAELMQTSYAAFLDALRGRSIYPELRSRGMALSFDQANTAYIPSLTAGGANGSFFAEGTPMRVGRITTAAKTMTPRKMGVIVPFSREAAKRSTPSLEAIVRNAILGDTAAILDAALLDATASSTARPAGLLNGVSAVATGYGGGDHIAVMQDFKALLAPFITANAASGITVIMNPQQGLALDFMIGPDGVLGDWFARARERFNFVESTYATANRLVAVRTEDFVTAAGDMPEFEMSTTATVHMEDTTPLEIVSGTGPTTADPVRSFFQTDTMGIRMVMDVSWLMRRDGMVQWIDGTSW